MAIEFTRKKDSKGMIYLERARAYEGLNDFQKAFSDYNKFIQEDPKIPMAEPYYGRGRIYYKLGNLRQAISDFDKAIEFGLLAGWFDRGLAYSKLGNQKRAVEDMEAAACTGVKEAEEFLKSRGLWGKTPEAIREICRKRIEELKEEYRKKEGQRKTSKGFEFVPVPKKETYIGE